MANLSKEKELDYNRIKTEIESFERGIMENSKLSKEEKDYILQGTSIARNSFYYWGKETVFWEPEGTSISENKGKGKGKGKGGRGFWKKFTVVLADVAGFFIDYSLTSSVAASELAEKAFSDYSQPQVSVDITSVDITSETPNKTKSETPNKTKEEPVDLSDEGVLVYEYEEIDTPRGKMFKIVGKRYDDPATYDPRRKKALDKALKAKAEGVMLPVDDIGKKP